METAADLKSKSEQRLHDQDSEPKESEEAGKTVNIKFNKLSLSEL